MAQESPVKRKDKRNETSEKTKQKAARRVEAEFVEDDEEVICEVQDPSVEFMSEDDQEAPEQGEIIRSEEEDSKEEFDVTEERSRSRNNNASVATPGCSGYGNQEGERKAYDSDSDDAEVTIKHKSKRQQEQDREEEEQGMQRVIDYMEKQGLVVMNTSQVFNQTPKFGEVAAHGPNKAGKDNESVITVFHLDFIYSVDRSK